MILIDELSFVEFGNCEAASYEVAGVYLAWHLRFCEF
jgi:hypothetical protein